MFFGGFCLPDFPDFLISRRHWVRRRMWLTGWAYSPQVLVQVGKKKKTEKAKVQYHTWAHQGKAFCLCTKWENPITLPENMEVDRRSKCVYLTNSSLIPGLPCMRANKLPSHEAVFSIARYACLPTRKSFHVWGVCRRLLVECTCRYVWSVCICVSSKGAVTGGGVLAG